MQIKSEWASFGGRQTVYVHNSAELGGPAEVAIFTRLRQMRDLSQFLRTCLASPAPGRTSPRKLAFRLGPLKRA